MEPKFKKSDLVRVDNYAAIYEVQAEGHFDKGNEDWKPGFWYQLNDGCDNHFESELILVCKLENRED